MVERRDREPVRLTLQQALSKSPEFAPFWFHEPVAPGFRTVRKRSPEWYWRGWSEWERSGIYAAATNAAVSKVLVLLMKREMAGRSPIATCMKIVASYDEHQSLHFLLSNHFLATDVDPMLLRNGASWKLVLPRTHTRSSCLPNGGEIASCREQWDHFLRQLLPRIFYPCWAKYLHISTWPSSS